MMLSVKVQTTLVKKRGEDFTLDAAFEADAGITILFGPSGAGKSTLLACIAGLETPERGRVVVNGETYFDHEGRVNRPVCERRVGYVFQSLALFPHLSVAENIGFGLRRVAKAERAARVGEMLEKFGIWHVAASPASSISGGEAQRTALARALVIAPQVLLLDEPLSALDAANKHTLMAELKRLRAANPLPIVYVTHSRDEAVALGERLIVMEAGRVIERTTPLEYFAAVAQVHRDGVAAGIENLLGATVEAYEKRRGALAVRLYSDGAPSDCRLEIPLREVGVGEKLAVAIASGDILLATHEPHGLSARNVLGGRVGELREHGGEVMVIVYCGQHNVPLVAALTRAAVDELQIKVGKPVWLIIKAHACRVVR